MMLDPWEGNGPSPNGSSTADYITNGPYPTAIEPTALIMSLLNMANGATGLNPFMYTSDDGLTKDATVSLKCLEGMSQSNTGTPTLLCGIPGNHKTNFEPNLITA